MYILCMYMSVSRTYMVYACLYLFITLRWCSVQANSKNSAGCVRLDINLLKPSRIEFVQDTSPSLSLPDGHRTTKTATWLEYVYRTAHPVLRWLPTKLAEWIGENLQDELGFPDKADQRAEPGSGWTPAELNHILQSHVVDGALSTFGCVDWESDLCRGVMRARCYPFDMPKHRFHGFNPQVLVHTLQKPVHTCYIHVHT